MSEIQEIPAILDQIFAPLAGALPVRINYAVETNHGKQSITITMVNHCNSPQHFRTRYAVRGIKIQQKLSRVAREWKKGEQDLFYDQAILRAEKLLENLLIPLSNLHLYYNPRPYEIPRIFTSFKLIGPPEYTPSKEDTCTILIKAQPYAQAWYQAIQSLIVGIISMITSLEISFDPRNKKGALIPQEFQGHFGKIRFKGSVAVLGALLRILIERCIIDSSNKSDICRLFAALFTTQKQTEISWKSLKNHFDCPTETALRYWDIEVSHWHHLSRKLISLN
jgi:hypothetical protein